MEDLLYLDEGGVKVTNSQFSTPEQSFEFSKIESVRLGRMRRGLLAWLRRQKPVFRLLVRPRGNAKPVIALETQDAGFIQRVAKASHNAAAANDRRHIEVAHIWLARGDYPRANKAFEEISMSSRTGCGVLELRWQILALAGRWDACLEIGEALVKCDLTGRSSIHRSFALHELKRTQEAFDKLLPAWGRFNRDWTVPYNLACYCAQLGRLQECQEWLKKATAKDEKAVQLAALDDPDLKPLWDSLSGTTWKRC